MVINQVWSSNKKLWSGKADDEDTLKELKKPPQGNKVFMMKLLMKLMKIHSTKNNANFLHHSCHIYKTIELGQALNEGNRQIAILEWKDSLDKLPFQHDSIKRSHHRQLSIHYHSPS